MTKANCESFSLAGEQPPFTAERSKTETVPLTLTLIAVTMFLPEETSFYIGTIRMTIVRALLLLVAPIILFRFTKMSSKPSYRFVWADVLIPILGLWMMVALTVAESLERGLVFGGVAALEICIPYMAMRLLTEHRQALKITKTFLYAISLVGLLALLDWATNEWYVRSLASSFTGYSKISWVSDWGDAYRFGLLRATSTIEHPILMGTICAFGVCLSIAYHGWPRRFFTISCLIGIITSLSSAPTGALILGIIFIINDKLFRRFPSRRKVMLSVTALTLAIVFIGSSNPWAFIFNKICFDPATAAYRLMEWQIYWPFVMSSPIFGIGTSSNLSEDILPSVDLVWLRQAMLFGIPGMILLVAVFLGAASIKIDLGNPRLNLMQDEKKLALALDTVIFISLIAATTVYFWGTISILMACSIGLRAHLGNLASLSPNNKINQQVL